jgi:UDP-N-acetylmuramate--alanine ligase
MIIDGRHIRSVYFLGIGGIGMSALARYFKNSGLIIHGYDKVPSKLTEALILEGMEIHFADDPGKIPNNIDLAVYTPAIPSDLKELDLIREMGVPQMKRAEVLGKITRDKFTLAVAGSHGKTTITSMIAHILAKAGKPVTALMGGISKNYGSNFIQSGKAGIMVVEADEFDRSFLHLYPDIAVISSMDPDHLDVYTSHTDMLESFAQFARQIKPTGKAIIKAGLEKKLHDLSEPVTYTAMNWADFSIKDLIISEGKHMFTILGEGKVYPNIRLAVPGIHNVENSLAAVAACHYCQVSPNEIISGLSSFIGVKRRFDIRIDVPGKVFIDDYAHHPIELDTFINTVKELYPGGKITGIFQPHLYSRTMDFASEFARSMDLLDDAILLDIYPAREKPIPGVSSRMILEKMKNMNKELADRKELIPMLERKRPEILLTIGAGDIDLLVEPIENLMRRW